VSTKATVSDSTPPGIAVQQREVDGRTVVVAIAGELDLATAPALKFKLLDALGAGYTRLVLDLSGVSFMDSTAIGVLVGVKRHFTGGEQLVLASLQPDVLKIFEVTGLDGSFQIASSVEAALSNAGGEGPVAA
jgi:anti-sigma B factor antagonist